MPRTIRYHECPLCQGTGQNNIPGHPQQGQACWGCGGSGQTKFLRLMRWYHLFDGQLLALAQSPYTLTIEATADFEWVALVSTQTGAFNTTMRDSQSGRYYEAPASNAAPTTASGAVNNGNRFGTASLPFYLPVPEVLPMRTGLSGVITDLSNATNTIQADLWGYELYTAENPPNGTPAPATQ